MCVCVCVPAGVDHNCRDGLSGSGAPQAHAGPDTRGEGRMEGWGESWMEGWREGGLEGGEGERRGAELQLRLIPAGGGGDQ